MAHLFEGRYVFRNPIYNQTEYGNPSCSSSNAAIATSAVTFEVRIDPKIIMLYLYVLYALLYILYVILYVFKPSSTYLLRSYTYLLEHL
jgi:hypothetical protein